MDVEIGESALEDSEPSSAKKLKQNEGDVAKDCEKSNPEGSTTGSLNLDNLNGSISDLSCQEHNEADENVDDVSDYEDNDDYMYDLNDDDDDGDDDDYLKMQAQFDNVDLPPGIEAPVSWPEDPSPSASAPSTTSSSSQNNVVGQETEVGRSSLQIHEAVINQPMTAGTSSSTVLTVSTSAEKDLEEKEDEVLRKLHLFKRFDTVDDFSDHHFNRAGLNDQQPPKNWVKRIQDEWKILEKDLPDKIYVRVYETRMDLLRAIIIGPAGTPYHDGLFVFDVLFPATYPDIPPMVYYYSGGLRLNPNLYDCGKVCLSLLNTWSGDKNEMWMPKTSTMLQVIVSIQALILNAKPFFNEPGYANMYTGVDGDRRSKAYNEDVFILSLKTMMYTLRRPPKYFEDFVAGHFRLRAHDILVACKAYMEGAEVGSAAKGRVQGTNNVGSNQRNEFMQALTRMMNSLITNFAKNGSKDCEQFRLPG